MKRLISVILFALLVVVLAACGGKESKAEEIEKVTIGYFPNLNHAPAIIAREKELFEAQLGDDVEVEYVTFSGGSDFMTALAANEIDAGLVGPGPAMNSFTTGVDVVTIASASTGGTVIMSSKDSGVVSPEDIDDHTFISPHIGCTHNVQFETFMKENLDVTSARTGGSMVHVTGKPAQYGTMFENGDVDVATAPEPWASALEADGHQVVIDTVDVSFGETLPAAIFVTTSDWIENKPQVVQKLINAHEDAIDFINDNEDEAIELTIQGIDEVTGQKLERDIMDKAWTRTFFVADVDEEAVQDFGDASFDLKFLKEKPDFTGFVDQQFLTK